MSGNQFDKKSQAWSALFSEPMSDLVQRYTSSVGFDQRLWRADIAGSLAHAGMLAAQGIIGAADLADIQRGRCPPHPTSTARHVRQPIRQKIPSLVGAVL